MNAKFQQNHPNIFTQLEAADKKLEEAEFTTNDYRNLMRDAMCNLRDETGMTAKQFGALGGVSKAYIYSLEKCKRPWNKELASTIISALEDNGHD